MMRAVKLQSPDGSDRTLRVERKKLSRYKGNSGKLLRITISYAKQKEIDGIKKRYRDEG